MAGLQIRDTRAYIPVLRDGSPTIGEINGMVITATGAVSLFTENIDVGTFTEGIVFLNVTANSGTNPTLDVKVQYGYSNKGPWIDAGDAFTQVTTTNSLTLKKLTANFGRHIRFRIDLGGTNPSYTVGLKVVLKG